jgi:hypothetical protein
MSDSWQYQVEINIPPAFSLLRTPVRLVSLPVSSEWLCQIESLSLWAPNSILPPYIYTGTDNEIKFILSDIYILQENQCNNIQLVYIIIKIGIKYITASTLACALQEKQVFIA